jgi:hypothetical protein
VTRLDTSRGQRYCCLSSITVSVELLDLSLSVEVSIKQCQILIHLDKRVYVVAQKKIRNVDRWACQLEDRGAIGRGRSLAWRRLH